MRKHAAFFLIVACIVIVATGTLVGAKNVITFFNPATGINSFSGDQTLYGRYRFEQGNLATDSSGYGHDLATGGEPAIDASIFAEGWTAAGYGADNNYHHLPDNQMAAGHPFAAATTERDFSVCFWMYRNATETGTALLFNKTDAATSKGYAILSDDASGTLTGKANSLYIKHAYDTGASDVNIIESDYSLQNERWYFLYASYSAEFNRHSLSLWDNTAAAWVEIQESSDTHLQDLHTSALDLTVATRADKSAATNFDGNLDELLVFGRVLQPLEIMDIKDKTYQFIGNDLANYYADRKDIYTYLRFEANVNGIGRDSSFYSYDLAATNAPSFSASSFKEGTSAADFEYDSDQWLNLPYYSLPFGHPLNVTTGIKDFTTTFWFNIEAAQANQMHLMGVNSVYALAIDNASGSVTGTANALHVKCGTDGGATFNPIVSSGVGLSAGQWYFAAASYEKATRTHTLKIWDDATRKWLVLNQWQNSHADDLPSITNSLSIGTLSDTDAVNFDGLMDEFIIWSKVLTDSEISAIKDRRYRIWDHDFAGDDTVWGLYRFEAGAMGRDDSGRNQDLTILSHIEQDRANYIQGGSAATTDIDRVATNLLPYSQDFSQWSAASTILTSGYDAPDGTPTAHRLGDDGTDQSSGAQGYITTLVTPETGYTASCYVKNIDSTRSGLMIYNVSEQDWEAYITFDWSGTQITGTQSVRAADIRTTPIGGGWWRVSFSFTTSAGETDIRRFEIHRDRLQAGKEILAWGAQLEASNFLSGYIATSGAAASATFGGGFVIADADLDAGHPLKANDEWDSWVSTWVRLNGEKDLNKPGYIFSKSFAGDFYQVNLVSNGHFSNDTSGWIAVEGTLDLYEFGVTGNAIEIKNTTGAGQARQLITVEPGKWYKLSGYYHGPDAGLNVSIGSSTYQWVGDLVSGFHGLTSGFQYFEYLFQAKTTNAYLFFSLNSVTVDDTAYVDTVKLQEMTLGPERFGPNLLVNGDFSDTTSTDSSVAALAGWTNQGTHNSSNKWTISNGECRLVSDGTLTQIEQYILETGRTYWYKIKINNVTANSIRLFFGSDLPYSKQDYAGIGVHTGFFVAQANVFGLKIATVIGNTDITFDDVEVREVYTPWPLYKDNFLTNNSFIDGATGWTNYGSGTATIDYTGAQAAVTCTATGSQILAQKPSSGATFNGKPNRTYYYAFDIVARDTTAGICIGVRNDADGEGWPCIRELYPADGTGSFTGFFEYPNDFDEIFVGVLANMAIGESYTVDNVAIQERKSLTNGLFYNSTGTDSTIDDQLGWVNASFHTHNATNKFLINTDGTATLISDGTLTGVYQNVLEPNEWYFYSVDVINVASGRIKIRFGTEENSILLQKPGRYSGYFKASGNYLEIKRSTACNVTIDNVFVEKIAGFSYGLFVDDNQGTKTGTANSVGLELGFNHGADRQVVATSGASLKPGQWYWISARKAALQSNETVLEVWDMAAQSTAYDAFYTGYDFYNGTGVTHLTFGGRGSLSPEFTLNGTLDETTIFGTLHANPTYQRMRREAVYSVVDDNPEKGKDYRYRYAYKTNNDFTDAPGLWGVYNFNMVDPADALSYSTAPDSSGRELTLASSGAPYIRPNEQVEGNGSFNPEPGTSYYYLEEANMPDGHPFKSTSGECDFSVTAWIYRYSNNTNYRWILSKGSGVAGKNSYSAFVDDSAGSVSGTPYSLVIQHGHTNGDAVVNIDTDIVISQYLWTFLHLTYDASTNTHRARVYPANWASGPAFEEVPTANDMNKENEKFMIGARDSADSNFNGYIDQVTIWDRIITDGEADNLAYGVHYIDEQSSRFYRASEHAGYKYQGQNDVTDDPDAWGHYRFEEGALTADSSSKNVILIDQNANTATSRIDYAAGNASAKFDNINLDNRLYVNDANLPSGHPLKGATGETDFSITGWFKTDKSSDDLQEYYGTGYGGIQAFFSKFDHVLGKRFLTWYFTGSNSVLTEHGYGDGSTWEQGVSSLGGLKKDAWYFLHLTYSATSNTFTMRMWDEESQRWYPGAIPIKTATGDVSWGTAPMVFGAFNTTWGTSTSLDGWLDDWIIWGRVLSNPDAEWVKDRQYNYEKHTANDFSGDTNVYGVYNFEAGALATDSSGKGNTISAGLTATADVVAAQGASAAWFSTDVSQYMYRNDSSLSTGHPFKSTTGEHDFSVTGWFRPSTSPNLTNYTNLMGSATANDNSRMYSISLDTPTGSLSGNPYSLTIRHGIGTDFEYLETDKPLNLWQWYFIHATYRASNNTHTVRIWDDVLQTWSELPQSTYASANNLYVGTSILAFGNVNNWAEAFFNGQLDEFVIWDRLLNIHDADLVKNNTYSIAAKSSNVYTDSDIVSAYGFEPNQVTTDSSSNGQTLTYSGTGYYWEANAKSGTGGAGFNQENNTTYYRTDTNLATGHPFKSTTGESDFSLTGWFNWKERKDNSNNFVFGKYYSGDATFYMGMDMQGNFVIGHGYNGGATSTIVIEEPDPLETDRWYFLHSTYDASVNAHTVRVWDDAAQAWLDWSSNVAIAANDLYIGTSELTFGNENRLYASADFDGVMDEWIIWKRVLTNKDADEVKDQSYSATLGSNDFSSDPDVYGAYNFEPGQITIDSSGNSETLTQYNTPTQTSLAPQGNAAAVFVQSDNDGLYRADASLTAGHPLKSTSGEGDFSVTLWAWIDAFETGILADSAIFNKMDYTNNKRTYALILDSNAGHLTGTQNSLLITHGWNNGASGTYIIKSGISLEEKKWYFVHATYTAATNTHTLRIWDKTANQWLTLDQSSAAAANDMWIGDQSINIGCRGDLHPDADLDGRIDEVVIWDRVLSDSDANAVKGGTYAYNAPMSFDASFESGNGTSFSESPEGTANVVTKCDASPAPTTYGDNFYFKLSNVLNESATVKVDFTNDRSGGPYEADSVQDIHPFYSYDGTTWTYVDSISYSGNIKQFTIPNSGTATGNNLYTAFAVPYTYSNLLSDITTWNATGKLTANLDLGDSSDGTREVRYLEVGDGPFHIAVTARAHPRETHASYYLKGMIDYLTTDWQLYRDLFTFHVFPMLNPDGVYKGGFRAFTNGEDANRDYDTTGPHVTNEEDETYLMHTKYATFAANVDLHIDVHSSYEAPILYRDSTEFNSTKETAIENYLDTYDSQSLWPSIFANAANPGLSVNTTWREGVYTQYGIDAMLIEGGTFRTGTTGYITTAEQEQMGEDIIKSAAWGILYHNDQQLRGGSNTITDDPNIYGHYRFESGALETDSSGLSQTLTATGPPSAKTNHYIEGFQAAYYNDAENDYHYRSDANLATGHPFKSTTGEHDFSVTFWFRRDSTDTNIQGLISKYSTTDNQRSYQILLDDDSGTGTGTANSLHITHGFNSGASGNDIIETGFVPYAGLWYFVHATYTASSNTHTVRIWSQSENEYKTLTKSSDSHASDMYIGTANFEIARASMINSTCFRGIIDDVTIWDKVLSDADANDVRDRNFVTTPSFSCTENDADVIYEPLSSTGALCSGWTPTAAGSATYDDNANVSSDSPCASQLYSFELTTVGDGSANWVKNFTENDHVYAQTWFKLASESLADGNMTSAFVLYSPNQTKSLALIYFIQGNGSNNCAAGTLCTFLGYRNSSDTLINLYPATPTVLQVGRWYKLGVEWDKAGNDVAYWINDTLQVEDTANNLYQTNSPAQLMMYSSSSYSLNWFWKDIRIDNDAMPVGCGDIYTANDADMLYESLSSTGALCSGWTPTAAGSATYDDNADVSSDSPCANELYSFELTTFSDGTADWTKNFTETDHVYVQTWFKLASENLANGNNTIKLMLKSPNQIKSLALFYINQGNGGNNCAAGNLCTYLSYRNSSDALVNLYPASPIVLTTGQWYKLGIEWDKSGNDVAYWINDTLQVQDTLNDLYQTNSPASLTVRSASNFSMNSFWKDIRIDDDAMPVGCGNNFSADTDVFGLYNFEPGALGTDLSGNNQTMTPTNSPVSDAARHIVGSGSVGYDTTSDRYHVRTDANLATGHPLKSATGEVDFSIVYWTNMDVTSATQAYVISKYSPVTGGRKIAMVHAESTYGSELFAQYGYGSTSYATGVDTDITWQTDRWYWIHYSYDASTNGHKIRVWDQTAAQWLYRSPFQINYGGAANDMNSGTGSLTFGTRSDADTARFFTGNLDEVVIFDRIISDFHANRIMKGAYDSMAPSGNDFSGNSNLYGLYNFEAGALTTDSSTKSNTLSNSSNAPVVDASNFIRGTGSVNYDTTNISCHYITNANLSTGHPLKGATGEHDFTITGWFMLEDTNTDPHYLFSKYNAVNGSRMFGIAVDDNAGGITGYTNAVYVTHGYNSGLSYYDTHQVDAAIKQGYWYFIHHSYTASTNTHRTRVWDDSNRAWLTGGAVSTSFTGDDMYWSSTPDMVFGNRHDRSIDRNVDARMDEWAIFDNILSDADVNKILEGTYP